MVFCAETDVLKLEEDALQDRAGDGSSLTQSPHHHGHLLNRANQDKPLHAQQTPPLCFCQMWLPRRGQQPPALLKGPSEEEEEGQANPAVLGRKSQQPLPQALAALGWLSRCECWR